MACDIFEYRVVLSNVVVKISNVDGEYENGNIA